MQTKEPSITKKDFWDRNAARYDRFMRKNAIAYDQLYALLRPAVWHKTVLEVATGTGQVAKHLLCSDWCFPDSGSCSDYCAPSCARLLSLFLLADIVLTGKSKNIPWDFHFFGQIVVDKPENRAYTT